MEDSGIIDLFFRRSENAISETAAKYRNHLGEPGPEAENGSSDPGCLHSGGAGPCCDSAAIIAWTGMEFPPFLCTSAFDRDIKFIYNFPE